VGALLDVGFQVVREQDKWKGSVVGPKGLAVCIHGGGQRGAVLSKVGMIWKRM
jgi:hypothetical protein